MRASMKACLAAPWARPVMPRTAASYSAAINFALPFRDMAHLASCRGGIRVFESALLITVHGSCSFRKGNGYVLFPVLSGRESHHHQHSRSSSPVSDEVSR